MAGRADNRDGSLREILTGRHTGKWRVQFTQESSTGKKERLSRIFPTKSAGRTFLQELRRGSRVETANAEKELTLGVWFQWLSENDWPETIAPVTIAQRQHRFKKYVEAHFGEVPLVKIDALKVRAFYKHLRDQGVSAHTVISVRGDLVRAFNQAITPYQRVPHSLANPFRLPLQAPIARQAVALTPVRRADGHDPGTAPL